MRGFWRNPAGISAAAAVVVALTGIIALIISQSGGQDPVGPGRAGSSKVETTTNRVAAAEDVVEAWARKVTAECNAIEPRLVATGQSIISLEENSEQFNLNEDRAQQAADLIERLGNDVFYFSSSVSRITPPTLVVEQVTAALAKVDSAARAYKDIATAIRIIANTVNPQDSSIQETQKLAQQATSNLTDGLRALGVLGATSCSNLL